MNNEITMRPLIAYKGPHLEAILACILHPEIGRHLPYIPEASAEAGVISEIEGQAGQADCYFGFKAFHGLTNIALGCQSIFLGGVPTTSSSNCIWSGSHL